LKFSKRKRKRKEFFFKEKYFVQENKESFEILKIN